MATQVTNYQCPACTAPLQYSAETGKLVCEFCESSFEISEIEALYADKESQAADNFEEMPEPETEWDCSGLTEDWGVDAEGMRSYNCPTCGAELICEQTTAATACPYCGNPTVIPGQFSGALRPDYVIPFRLDKSKAIAALKQHYKGKIFLPKTFLETHTIEKIQGVYVPFWLYDAEAHGAFRFDATHVHIRREGSYEVTETNHFDVRRSGTLSFEKVPVDASSKMPDDYMDAIEPFDYTEMKEFSTAYLPGYLADKYDVSVEQSNQRADKRCLQSLEDSLTDSVMGYSSCRVRSKQTSLKRGKVHYALLPVWVLNVNWNGGNYLFAVNGQTGRTVGKLPGSKGKAMAFFAGLAFPLSMLGILLANLIVG